MEFRKFLILCLLLAVIQSINSQEVNHDQAVEDAIAEAENEEIAPPTGSDSEPPPKTVEEDDTAPAPEPEEEPKPEEDSDTPETNLDDSSATTPEDDEILNLPHLINPKYDEDGDVLFFPRIIGGSRAQLGEFPSKVSLQTRAGSHFCGGNLITNNHVISAAHCVVAEEGHVLNPASIEIMAGDTSITRNAGPHRAHRIVSHIFAHPKYNPYTMEHDIAILRVSIPFRSVEGVLVPEPLALGVPITGTICHLAGWGATSEGSNDASPNLMRVNLEIIDTNRCNTSYQGMLLPAMFCAGTMKGGRDACQGDSGGGLMCGGVITGIVSFGYGCARPRFPGVYVDASQYTDFIEAALVFDGTHQDIPTPNPRLPGGGAIMNHIGSVSLLMAALAVVVYM